MTSDINVPALASLADVARLVGLEATELAWWIYALPEERRYTTFSIARKSGVGDRDIAAPIAPIKSIQRRLLDVLSPHYRVPVSVHGFVGGRDIKSNATLHVRQQWVVNFDLANFFPSIHFGRVRGVFMAAPFRYPEAVATALASICCFKGALPQGSPMSPLLSNLVCRGLDAALLGIARRERCFYSRYADDLTFSTDRTKFPSGIARMSNDGSAHPSEELLAVIVDQGFTVNPRKSRVASTSARHEVTGVVVNTKLTLRSTYIREVRSLLYIWKKYGYEAADARYAVHHPVWNGPPSLSSPGLRDALIGKIQHIGHIRGWNDSVYRRLAEAMHVLDSGFDPAALHAGSHAHSVAIYTEGKTDPIHLTCALAYFHKRREFQDIALDVSGGTDCGSDEKLKMKLKILAEHGRDCVCIGVFDRDRADIVDGYFGGSPKLALTNGVGAIVLVPPAWRDDDALVCIEMLYDNEQLHRIGRSGRRLYLKEEFNDSGHHLVEDVTIPKADHGSLVQEKVIEFKTEVQKGLSKSDFADLVRETCDGISFEGFRPTFELLRRTAFELAATR
jgi:RNA-directed DNA polymerase